MYSTLCVIFALVTQVTGADRQYVAATISSPSDVGDKVSQAPEVGQSMIKKAIDGARSLGDALSQVQTFGAASNKKAAVAPVAVVWVRMSKGCVANYVERAVDRRK